MMQSTRLIIFLIAAFCCIGCDSIHGVSRTLPVNILPTPEVIEQSIWATPGVTEMKRVDVPPQGTGASPDEKNVGYWQFTCRDTTTASAAIECIDSQESGRHVQVYSYWINHVPDKMEFSNARELIGRLCVSLHEHAPVVPSSSSADDKMAGMP